MRHALQSPLPFRLFIGLRMINREKGKSNLIFKTLFAGIAGGLAVLVVVIGVMNGFQNNYISRRIEIGSYHADITARDGIASYRKLTGELYQHFPEIEAAVPYADREVIVLFKNSVNSEKQPLKLRAIDPDGAAKDTKFLKYFRITHGALSLEGSGVLLGEELGWREISLVRLGSEIYLTPDVSLNSLGRQGIPFQIRGYFNTGSYDYDRYWIFIGIDAFHQLTGSDAVDGIGLKFKDGINHAGTAARIKNYLHGTYEVRTAEEINSAYFAALRLEKTMVMFLFVIIFIMVAINIFGALKLTILEKKDSILILKAIGLTPSDIETIFIMESVLLAVGGMIVGLAAGIFISYNILNIFGVIEFFVNGVLRIALPEYAFTPIKLYDTSVYYQTDFLVKFYPLELSVICFCIMALTILSALIPVIRASRIRPNEINRTVM